MRLDDLKRALEPGVHDAAFEIIVAPHLAALIAVAEAAQDFIDRGREWIGGAKYCPECMAEGWHYEGCKSGQEIFDSRKTLAEAVEALSALKDA